HGKVEQAGLLEEVLHQDVRVLAPRGPLRLLPHVVGKLVGPDLHGDELRGQIDRYRKQPEGNDEAEPAFAALAAAPSTAWGCGRSAEARFPERSRGGPSRNRGVHRSMRRGRNIGSARKGCQEISD